MRLIDADALKEEMDMSWCPDMAVSEIWYVIDKAPTVVCSECKHWDSESGLSARFCDVWKRHTVQSEFCSRWVKRG